MIIRTVFLLGLLNISVFPTMGFAQTMVGNTLMNTVQLTSSVMQPVAQDTVTVRLSVEQSQADPAKLSDDINRVLRAAADEAKEVPKVKVYSGSYQNWPMTQPKGTQIDSWRARAELLLESTDFDSVSKLVGRLTQKGMQVAGLQFSLSPARRAEVEKLLTGQAIDSFREKSRVVTQQFGFTAYDLVEVTIMADSPMSYEDRVIRSSGMSMTTDVAPMTMEAGESRVTVQITGKIRMR